MGIVDKVKDTLWGAPDKGISGEPDPEELSVDNAYKTRWIWYHTILGLLMLMANMIMLAIFLLLAIKL